MGLSVWYTPRMKNPYEEQLDKITERRREILDTLHTIIHTIMKTSTDDRTSEQWDDIDALEAEQRLLSDTHEVLKTAYENMYRLGDILLASASQAESKKSTGKGELNRQASICRIVRACLEESRYYNSASADFVLKRANETQARLDARIK